MCVCMHVMRRKVTQQSHFSNCMAAKPPGNPFLASQAVALEHLSGLGCSSSGQVGPYRTPGPLVPLRTPSYIMQPSLSPLANRDDEPSSSWYRLAFLYFVGACMSHLIETY